MSRRLQLFAVALIVPIAFLWGCGKPTNGAANLTSPPGLASGGGETDVVAGDMTVFVPCGIAGPYGQLKALFEEQHPDVTITQEVANIDVQARAIGNGKAKPDLWISLGDREMQAVAAAERVDGEPVTYAYNSVAMIVRKGNPSGIESLADLKSDSVETIAVPSERNSSGYYVRQAFEKAGVWEDIQSKLWVTDQPSQVKMQLSSGKADVGIVYYPCKQETRTVGGKPQAMHGKVQLLGRIPPDLSGQIPAQAAVIKGCANPTAGRAFLDFLLTDEAQDIWEKWAFERAKQPASGERITLYLYCGAGIRPFMDKATERYKELRPNVRIDVGYAGSGCLLGQLTFARRGDLYMPGEDFYLNQAKDRGYIVSDKLVGYFEPVLIVQKGNPKNIQTLNDLTRPGLKVGVGEPEACAVGRTAEALLKNAGLWDAVQSNIALRAGNVPELGNDVQFKSLDVAIVWNVTAVQVAEKCDAIAIPKEFYEPSAIPIGILSFCKHKEQASAFMDFCTGEEGQKMVAETGMAPAKAKARVVAGG